MLSFNIFIIKSLKYLIVTIANRAKQTQLAKKVQCRTKWFNGLGNRYIYSYLFRLHLTLILN